MYQAHTAAAPNLPVALKVLDEQRRGEDQTTRLRREFGFAHRLDHPSSLVYQHGHGWFTMEMVDGGTASAPGRAKDQLATLTQIADALDYIHQCRIVRCDVKPSNILILQDFSRAV